MSINMKTVNYLTALILSATLCSFITAGCESHEPKVKDDFEEYKQDKQLATDSDSITKQAEFIKLKTESVIAKESTDEWVVFTILMEKKLQSNTGKIKSIRADKNASVKTLSRANRLEGDNADIRKKMDEYNADAKERMKSFSEKMKTDADAIQTELKELSSSK